MTAFATRAPITLPPHTLTIPTLLPTNKMGVTVAAGGVAPAPADAISAVWAGVHWLSGSTRLDPAEVVRILETFLDGGFIAGASGGNSYSHSLHGPSGAKVYLTPGRPDCLVMLPGQACEVLGQVNTAAAALACELSITRLDVAWDATGIAPGQVLNAFKRGDVVTRIHRTAIENRSDEISGWEERRSGEGTTVYLGSRASERFLRIYDRRGPTRFELEVKGARAALLWAHLLKHDEESWSGAAMAHLRDFIDFRDRSQGQQPRACPLLDWWAAVVADAGRTSLPIPRKPRTLVKAAATVEYQWSGTVAMVADSQADPEGYLLGLLELGRDRRRVHHVRMMADFKGMGSPPVLAPASAWAAA